MAICDKPTVQRFQGQKGIGVRPVVLYDIVVYFGLVSYASLDDDPVICGIGGASCTMSMINNCYVIT